MRNQLNLIEETLDLAMFLLERGNLTGAEYAKIVNNLERDYHNLIFESEGKNAGEIIKLLLGREEDS